MRSGRDVLAVRPSNSSAEPVLKLRILTALVLVPLFLGAVVFLSPDWFALIMALIMMLAAWEWTGLAGIHKPLAKFFYILTVCLLMLLAYRFVMAMHSEVISILAFIFWIAAAVAVIRSQQYGLEKIRPVLPARLMGLLVLVPAWLSLLVLRENEPDGVTLVLFLMLLIWCADISAYFCGRKWGKHKLCDKVSPGKSWEGVYGAVFSSLVLALLSGVIYGMALEHLLLFAGISVVTVLASILGDLLESLMKRLANVKDSSNLLPGHGGVLDRIDSLTAALPVFLTLLWIAGLRP